MCFALLTLCVEVAIASQQRFPPNIFVELPMQSPILPTSSQTLECFRICQQLTLMYLPIYLARLDERTSEIAILAGEEIAILLIAMEIS